MKRSKTTPEQTARAQEKRAKMQALAKSIAEMPEADRLALALSCPVVTIEGRGLSVKNQCLIALQNPGASIVGGFRQWLANGRAVRKGEHGLSIWVPTSGKKADGTEPEAGDVHFICGTVFDVSQTDESEQHQEASMDWQSASRSNGETVAA